MSNFKFKIHLWWLVPLLIFDMIFFAWWWKRFSSPLPSESKSLTTAETAGDKIIRVEFAYPTERELDRFNPENFQPTASGRPESAFYGSVRTERLGRRFFPSFHEGIDIAPVKRDRAGNPRDVVMAAADGEVVYANFTAGDSNYGKYIVMAHGGGAGKLYTLYAHLSKVAPGIRKNRKVAEGEILGIMGATSTDRIAPANGHLHFEVNLMLNAKFDGWMQRQRTRNEHGLFNGWNLIGIDPLGVYEKQEEQGGQYDLFAHLASLPPAFEIIIRPNRQLDFFRRYPALWRGDEYTGGGLVLACSENGLPLSGRPALPPETAEMGRKKHLVRKVDVSVLGRNGCRLVVNEKWKWRLGAEGEKWLNLLVF